MHCQLLTQYAIIMVQFLAGLRKIKLRAADNHNYMCHIWAKGFLDSNFNQVVIDKISNFQEIAPNTRNQFDMYSFVSQS